MIIPPMKSLKLSFAASLAGLALIVAPAQAHYNETTDDGKGPKAPHQGVSQLGKDRQELQHALIDSVMADQISV